MIDQPQKQSPVDKTGLSRNETADGAIVACAEKTGNSAKREKTLFAQFALRGFAVHAVSDGYLVTRWNLYKHVPTLDDLERFARVVGAA